jgi:hypothetical protein
MAGVSLQLDPEALRPLIEATVREAVAQVDGDRARLNGDLCYTEQEAAALLRLNEHQLRDERRRSRIRASAIVGRRIRYLREDLISYLLGRRWEANGKH